MKLGNELVKSIEVAGKTYDVYGCWDSDTPEGKFDFYDVHERESGDCVNLGEPFETIPTANELKDYLLVTTVTCESTGQMVQ